MSKSSLSWSEIDTILNETEHSGDTQNFYKTTFAVGKDILGQHGSKNNSGFTFGRPQLDIGTNEQGMAAFQDILLSSFTGGNITFEQFERLLNYYGHTRYDLDDTLKFTYADDLVLISQLTQLDYSKEIIDRYTKIYYESSLVKQLDRFFKFVSDRWGDATIFDRSHPDFSMAVAAVVSTANRTGNLKEMRAAFEDTEPTTIAQVKEVFLKTGRDDQWSVAEKGAAKLISHCFIADTPIRLWNGSCKSIQDIIPGDIVSSYDEDGTLCPGRVSKLFRNTSSIVLDLFGIGITPGHRTLCADGPLKGSHAPIIDILRTDGAIMLYDGKCVRASTNCQVGSIGDRFIWAVCGVTLPSGLTRVEERAKLRLGTRFIDAEGRDCSIIDAILSANGIIGSDGLIRQSFDGPAMPFNWTASASLPKPEDYILNRSRTSMNAIASVDGSFELSMRVQPGLVV